MVAFEKLCVKEDPDLVLVVGDVNSTLACSLTAVRYGIPVIHVEAGLRSFDRTMPEEVNRVLTDQVADLLLITCADAGNDLMREGCSAESIVMVGNPMIDTLMRLLPRALEEGAEPPQGDYCLITLHRPSNVDSPERLAGILEGLSELDGLELVLDLFGQAP